ncbi:AAA family ATPase [Neorhizobium alkalisoli]|uniref:AAA family ATPase n=1 Tax=Neorhizobium alkalisoli TaxID=528178 RepID=UPI000CF94365|nr:AAA family ATPase [Neorhizobium alkalisoli]
MKLVDARVQNFRSAEDTGQFTIEGVTCLVGKNEAGKSAVLQALAALNPHTATPVVFDKERDYPRRYLTSYDSRHPSEDAVVISTTWELEQEEIAVVEAEFGQGCLSNHSVGIVRRYGHDPEWSPDINFSIALEHLYTKHKLDASERSQVKKAETSDALIKLLKELGTLTDKQKGLLQELEKSGNITVSVTKILEKYLPKFMYFSNYDRMDGAIQIESVSAMVADNSIQRDDNRGKKLFYEFLNYAHVPIEEITKVTTFETFNARLQSASNTITDQILEYWTQNPDLAVNVEIDPARPGDPPPYNSGTIARARIYNQLHRVDTPFSERSTGFVWFFSFLVKFAQVKDEARPVILLLDEPGLTLHGKAQADLLRFFDEKLAPHHQIIYSTHSPFMVAPDRLMAARIVEDHVNIDPRSGRRSPIGTKVREDVLERDPDTLFPLQGALGYEISQTLFVGKNTLLVEGPSDILYLQALSEELRQRKRTHLDPRWTLCPSGGIGNIRPFMSLFGGNSLNVAVLSDHGANEKRKIEELRRAEILKAGHFYCITEFVDQPEGDIEDIFHPEIFVEILNAAYDVPKGNLITVESLENADTATPRLVKKAEAVFRTMPSSVAGFDHFAPAAWLIGNMGVLKGDALPVEETLARAEKIFATYNKLL